MIELTELVGLEGEHTERVVPERTAGHLGSGEVGVYATPAMVALVEGTCTRLVQPHLERGQTTVGIQVEVEHIAPTPVGEQVTARVRLVDYREGVLTFEFTVVDEHEAVGRGHHQRAIIDVERFMKRVEAKGN